MINVESPERTVLNFLNTPQWKNSDPETIASGLICAHNESHLKLNPWHYELKNGKLYDPRLKSFVSGSGLLDETEENVTSQLQDWFLANDSGVAVWISPRKNPFNNHPGYPEEQVTIYKIGYEFNPKTFETKKVLFLTSHQFNYKYKNPEEIRKFIFTEEDNEESILNILKYVENISSKKVEKNLKKDPRVQELAIKYASMHISGIPSYVIVEQMNKDNFLGKNPIGCAGVNTSGGFSYTENTSLSFGYEDQYGSLNFDCPHCGSTNTRPPGQLLSNCQHCGGDVRC